jgi:glycosyltransferase involved in cell wall biosynthesis
MKPKITILIATRNRPHQIKQCLKSILQNSFRDYQILIADQSDDEKTIEAINSFHSKKINMIRMQKGKSKGLNLLIKKAKTEILAFTDDDCIVDKDWLQTISQTYKNHPKLAGIFGNTYGYKPEDHLQNFCPSLFKVEKFQIHTFKNLNYYHVGLGNNMSLKKSVIEKIGHFQEWLGVGSIGKSGEESEIIFRILKNNFILATNPKMIVYHNRWLNYKQYRIQNFFSTHGFIAFLSYYLFTPNRNHAWFFIKFRIHEKVIPAFRIWVQSVKTCFKESIFLFLECFYIVKGIAIGLIMFIRKH